MNTKLMNVAIVLVIVCAVAFLALWAIPTFTQKAGKNIEKGAEVIAPIIDERKEASATNTKEEALREALQQIADEHPESNVQLTSESWYNEKEAFTVGVMLTDGNSGESVETFYEFSYDNGRLVLDGSYSRDDLPQ